eukprot:523260-Hanusia_phi.AAC.3
MLSSEGVSCADGTREAGGLCDKSGDRLEKAGLYYVNLVWSIEPLDNPSVQAVITLRISVQFTARERHDRHSKRNIQQWTADEVWS